MRGAVGSIAGICERMNQDSWLKNKVLRPLTAVSSELLSGWLRVTAERILLFFSRGIAFCTRDEVCANRLTACGENAISFSSLLTENQREQNISRKGKTIIKQWNEVSADLSE